MNGHYDGDGCTGQERRLSEDDHHAISERMGEMMLACARRDGRSVLRAGAHIGSHYGPGGEWALALRLATQVVGLAPLEDCDEDGVPVLHQALPEGDDRVLLLTAHCVSLFPETRDHTRDELAQAVKTSTPLVERFVGHYKHDRKDDCRATWEEMYDMTACDTPVTRSNTLRAGACSALLTCWATHYSAIRLNA